MSLNVAVSGIKAAGTDLGIIGNNIANAGTTGFKSSRGDFADVYASSLLGAGANSAGRGVSLQDIKQSFSQGNVATTGNALDMAISGNGFFALSDAGTTVYSRAGNFQVDRSGYVVNNAGNRLLVFQTTANGDATGEMGELRIDKSLIQPNSTAEMEATFNLDSRDQVPTLAWGGPFDAFAAPPTAPDPDMFNASTSSTVYDSLGNAHTHSMFFVKTATQNEWNVYSSIDGVSVTGPDTLTFDSSGQVDPATLPFEINITAWTPLDASGSANGAAAQDIVMDLSNTTQFGTDFAVNSIIQDGFTTGQLRGVEVDDTGVVFARFTNGQARTLGQIALANFANTDGLQPLGGTTWGETFTSGTPTLSAPGTAGMGTVNSGALEESNVEITEQLVAMIVAQRNFQANAQVIETENSISQTVINLR